MGKAIVRVTRNHILIWIGLSSILICELLDFHFELINFVFQGEVYLLQSLPIYSNLIGELLHFIVELTNFLIQVEIFFL